MRKTTIQEYPSDYQRIELFIRPPIKVIIHLPKDLTQKEADRLKQYIDLATSKSSNTEREMEK